jgi:hypothetical protein
MNTVNSKARIHLGGSGNYEDNGFDICCSTCLRAR